MIDEQSDMWARTSLGIERGPLSVDEIGRKIGQPTVSNGTEERWLAGLESDSGIPLTDQLAEAETFLADRADALAELPATCEIWLFMSWRPKLGQDDARFSRALVQLLGRVGADVTLDTWTGCEFCEPDDMDEDDDTETWATSSLGVRSAGLSVDEIGRMIGRPTADWKAENLWAVDFESNSDNPLEDELTAVERFLGDNIAALEELAATGETDLFMSWRPKVGQDHALFRPTLVQLLGQVGADVVLDTWTGCEFCTPDDDLIG